MAYIGHVNIILPVPATKRAKITINFCHKITLGEYAHLNIFSTKSVSQQSRENVHVRCRTRSLFEFDPHLKKYDLRMKPQLSPTVTVTAFTLQRFRTE